MSKYKYLFSINTSLVIHENTHSFAYLENFERPRQRRCLGAPQGEEEVEKRFPVVFLKHYLFAGFCCFRSRGCGFTLLARVLDQALPSTDESWRL